MYVCVFTECMYIISLYICIYKYNKICSTVAMHRSPKPTQNELGPSSCLPYKLAYIATERDKLGVVASNYCTSPPFARNFPIGPSCCRKN